MKVIELGAWRVTIRGDEKIEDARVMQPAPDAVWGESVWTEVTRRINEDITDGIVTYPAPYWKTMHERFKPSTVEAYLNIVWNSLVDGDSKDTRQARSRRYWDVWMIPGMPL